MRGSVLLRSVAIAGALCMLAEASGAQQRPQSRPQYDAPAQTQPFQVQPFSVERQMQRYNRSSLPDPVRDRERAERDRLKRLGLPYHDPDAPKGTPTSPFAPTPLGVAPGPASPVPGGRAGAAAPGAGTESDPNFSRLDLNRDGFVSRQEYLNSRKRATPPAVRNTWRERSFEERADSRFRANDRNRDGRIAPDEMKDPRNPRF